MNATNIAWISPESRTIAQYVLRAIELALPVSLFYGVLPRRTLDIGFVFNRVAIYGVLSVLLVAIFTLLEYAIGRIVDTSRTDSLLIQLGVALGIAFSARYFHGVVERAVDRVFFAKRHADELALRRFAGEAEVFTSEDALLDRTIVVLRDHCEARGAAIYLNDEGTARAIRADGPFPASIDVNDPLIVKVRRWNEPVDTNDVRTAFPDGMVFPVTARGKLRGALACQAKRDGSAFDPDERKSLGEVARGVGAGLDAVASPDGDVLHVLTALNASIEDGFAALASRIDALRAGDTKAVPSKIR